MVFDATDASFGILSGMSISVMCRPVVYSTYWLIKSQGFLTSTEDYMGANILDGAPPAIRDLLTSMWADIERSSRELEERKAKADPTKHRDSRVIENASYRYYGTKNGCGSRVRFCYSTHRNVAGYFLIWREVVTKSEVKRDQWDSSKSKADAKLARRKRWEAARTRPHPAGWYLTKA